MRLILEAKQITLAASTVAFEKWLNPSSSKDAATG
jgi:hypothetical protein